MIDITHIDVCYIFLKKVLEWCKAGGIQLKEKVMRVRTKNTDMLLLTLCCCTELFGFA